MTRLDLKNCSFAVTRLTQLWRWRLKIFYWTSKIKIFFEFPKHFLRPLIILTLSFTFQMYVCILLNISIISAVRKTPPWKTPHRQILPPKVPPRWIPLRKIPPRKTPPYPLLKLFLLNKCFSS